MTLWQVVAQQETRQGEWSGSEQVPTFYVDTHTLTGAVRKAVDVLWDGRNPSGPLHLTLLEVDGALSQVPGARVRSFTIVRADDSLPEGREVVCTFLLGRIDVRAGVGESVNAHETR